MANVSTGRGGAGNVSRDRDRTSKNKAASPAPPPARNYGESATVHLVTPHLKEKQYTTGRGGSGNIVPNDDPEVARKAQDVDTPPVRREFKPGEAYHHGRGGEGNLVVTKGKDKDKEKSAASNGSSGSSAADASAVADADGNLNAPRETGRKKERRGSHLAEKGKEILGRLRSGDRQRRGSFNRAGSESAVSEAGS